MTFFGREEGGCVSFFLEVGLGKDGGDRKVQYGEMEQNTC